MSKTPSIAESDENMAVHAADTASLKWFSAGTPPFQISGLPFFYIDHIFRRLPANPNPPTPNEGVEHLSWHTSGAAVRFRSDTSRVVVKVVSRFGELMDHMAQTGNCGCDLYIGEPPRFFGTSRYAVGKKEYEVELFNFQDSRKIMRSFIINLPLYDGVKSFEIAVDSDAAVEPPNPWSRQGAIVWYGTSIQQGGCANRPGMGMTNILSRKLNMEIVNMAFSGSGKGEAAMAHLMAQVPDPAMFVLDYEANAMTVENLATTLPVLIDILREKYPLTPITVISRIKFSHECIDGFAGNTGREIRRTGRGIQRREVESRLAAGDAHIYFVDGGELLGEDYHECTVDGIHPTDLGFSRIAENLEPVLRSILNL